MLLALTLMLSASEQTVYIGTRNQEGIYRMQFDLETGAMRDVQLAAKTIDPTFLALHPTKPFLFAVQASVPEGKVKSFAIQPDGSLRELSAVSSKGAGPAHVQVDPSGQWLATANYHGGSMAVFRIGADGTLSEATDWKQHEGKATPHAHSCYFTPDSKTLYVADLGLDEVKIYGFDAATGKLTPKPSLHTPSGSGPRHLAFHGNRIYVLNELASSVSVFENGKILETVNALPEGFTGKSSASEIVIDQSGKFLYASNRGAETIAVFRIGDKLQKVQDAKVGPIPRGYVLSPNGRFLIAGSQTDNEVQVYKLDPANGTLTPTGPSLKVGYPICFRFATVAKPK